MADEKLIRRIAVGVDGSEHAAAALEWAVDLARVHQAEVVAVFAIDSSAATYSMEAIPIPQYDPVWRDAMQREFEDRWCEPLRTSGLPHRMIFADGRPAVVLSDIAEEIDADLVVVGRRGRGGVAELVLGSVSHELSHRCSRPVMLVSHRRRVRKAA